MNPAFFTKSAKGLVFAVGVSLLTGIAASAQAGSVALGSTATNPLSARYANPPSGPVTLGGVPFTVGSFASLAYGQTLSLPVSYQNAKAVYLLLNTAYTGGSLLGTKVGTVQLTFAGGTTQSVDLTAGGNVREWRVGAGPGWVITLSDPAAANVWTGTDSQYGSTAVLDMLKVSVASSSNTLTAVSVSNINSSGLTVVLSGITVDYTPTIVPPPTTGGGHGPKHPKQHKKPTHPTHPVKLDSHGAKPGTEKHHDKQNFE